MNNNKHITMFDELVNNSKVVDLSHDFEEGMPAWPTQARYGYTVYESYDYGDESLHARVTFSEHTGTHIDAPKHFIRGGDSIDQLPPSKVMGRGVTIDATNVKPRGLLELEQIIQFEEDNGPLKSGDICLIRFGWEDKWALQPNTGEFMKDWPGLSENAAHYFVEKGIFAVGCDTIALDAFGTEGSVSHGVLLNENIPIIENLCNLKELPVFSYVIGLPMKFKGGSGSPIRVVAFVQNQ